MTDNVLLDKRLQTKVDSKNVLIIYFTVCTDVKQYMKNHHQIHERNKGNIMKN